MARILVANHVTLDGVMQAPARVDEDTRDGFAHGGWAISRNDDVMASKIGERMAAQHVTGALLRRYGPESWFAVQEHLQRI